MDKIRQNIYLEPDTHAALKVAATEQRRSAQNLGAFIIYEWLKARQEAEDRAVLRAIWEDCKYLLDDGQGCLLCQGAGYVSIEVGGHDTASRFMHGGNCKWPALDAAMRNDRGEQK